MKKSDKYKEFDAVYEELIEKYNDIDEREYKAWENGEFNGLDSPFDIERKQVKHDINAKIKELWKKYGLEDT